VANIDWRDIHYLRVDVARIVVKTVVWVEHKRSYRLERRGGHGMTLPQQRTLVLHFLKEIERFHLRDKDSGLHRSLLRPNSVSDAPKKQAGIP
jgi:hypothetical protein